jgi:lipid A disaccharide synthetase
MTINKICTNQQSMLICVDSMGISKSKFSKRVKKQK